jgi:endo-1,4-beta-xylanase
MAKENRKNPRGKGTNHKQTDGTDPNMTPLKDVMSPIIFGTMANEELIDDATGAIDSLLSSVIVTQSNMYATGNKAKWRQLLTANNTGDPWDSANYDFTVLDRHVQFCVDNNLGFKGHTLMWSKTSFVPNDFNDSDLEARNNQITKHIDYVMTRYASSGVIAWDVWNEFVSTTDGGGDDPGLKNDPAINLEISVSDITLAFVSAQAADPNAILVANDFKNMGGNSKTDRMIGIIGQLLDDGAPISAVGFQAHIDLGPGGYQPTSSQIVSTELDISVSNVTGTEAYKQQLQREYAEMLAYVCQTTSGVHSLSIWGLSDEHSWIFARNLGPTWTWPTGYPGEQPLPFGPTSSFCVAKPFFYGLSSGFLNDPINPNSYT